MSKPLPEIHLLTHEHSFTLQGTELKGIKLKLLGSVLSSFAVCRIVSLLASINKKVPGRSRQREPVYVHVSVVAGRRRDMKPLRCLC